MPTDTQTPRDLLTEAADTEMAAMLAAYAALGTLSPRAQGRALNWIEARLQDEADQAAGGTTGRGRVGWLRAPSADGADIPF